MSAPRALLAEFADADGLRRARALLLDAGCAATEWFGPHALDNVAPDSDAGLQPRALPRMALLGALAGGIGGFLLQYYAAVYDYPILVAGRPLDSAVAFLPAALELTLLGAALGVVAAFLRRARLLRYHDPLFEVAEFSRASSDRWFLRVDTDAGSMAHVRAILRQTTALAIHEVDDAGA
jgi:hypothetical protein